MVCVSSADLMAARRGCVDYAKSLVDEKPDWAAVALECCAIIDDAGKWALTIEESRADACLGGYGTFFSIPEIDYTSGLPRK